MRWLTVIVLWLVAVVAALVILRRVRRGKPVVLAGRWSPRLVRMIAVVLVIVGAGEEARPPHAGAAPAKLPIRTDDDQLPPTFQASTIQAWLTLQQEGGRYDHAKKILAQTLAADKPTKEQLEAAVRQAGTLPEPLQKVVKADLAARGEGKAAKPTAAELTAALDGMEKYGRFDHFWNAYLWRQSAAVDVADRIELYARFRRHARITDALVKAHAQVRPVMQAPRAWASKAGPRPGDMPLIRAYETSLADMLKVAGEVLPATDEGTWKRDGVVLLKPVAGSPAPKLIRAGKERVLPEDESTRFGRLDLLKTGDKPAVVAHEWLGKIELPANRLISVWELPDLLPDAAKQKLDETVLDAMKTNSEEAADRLERCLPLSHRAIRAGLGELPMRKGAPRLRLILTLFDDTVMPALPTFTPKEDAGGFGGGGFGGGGFGGGGGARGGPPGGR